MTGRYLIYTPVQSAPDEKRFDAAWRRFAEICRSFHRDGLDYSVQLNLAAARPHILVTASGKAKPSKAAGAHRPNWTIGGNWNSSAGRARDSSPV